MKPLATLAPLTVVLQPVKDKPIVALRVVFHTGAVDDPAGKEGLTALTTDLLSEGGTQELTAAQLLDALFPMAAELDARADKEFTVFEGRVHVDRLDRFLQIFTDVLLKPRFDPKEFERLRTQALNTVKTRLRQESDEELSKVGLDSVLYTGHPYRHFNGGTVKGLGAITLDDVKAHWAKVFTQDRAVLGLAGASIHLELILNILPPMKLLNPTPITVMKTNTAPFLATENSPRINFLALKLCVSVLG